MALSGSDVDRPLYGRGPSPGLRFTLYAIVSIVLMYYDRHGQLVQRFRYGLQAMVYPVQVAVGSPEQGWRAISDSFQTRRALRAENAQLRAELRDAQLATMRQAALEQENAQLRNLRASLPPLISHWQLAQIIDVQTDPLRERLVIDKGAREGVRADQAVVDSHGILGQVERVGPFSAEVILVTDPEGAIPVQVLRNGLRTIAVGGGTDGEIVLPYLASNADIKSGDLLVTSGLGGVFPAGFPVGRVMGVRRDSSQLPAQVRAQPVADIERDREVALLQFSADNPSAPAPNPPIAPVPAAKSKSKSKPHPPADQQDE
ncbi:MAG TPA: rod shape-determining protein MreC [Steroidobacteraceae bacterium]|nr:rod shape-determining protein MreC [Steroidobacteraceae bacterium]